MRCVNHKAVFSFCCTLVDWMVGVPLWMSVVMMVMVPTTATTTTAHGIPNSNDLPEFSRQDTTYNEIRQQQQQTTSSFNSSTPFTDNIYTERSALRQSLYYRLTSEPLIAWLDRLQLVIPDMSYTVDLITIEIHNLTCTHFTITNVQSTYVPSSVTPKISSQIQISIQNISATCTGNYHVSPGGVSGNIFAQ
jgi:hypothetical protein